MGYDRISFKDGFVTIDYDGISTKKSENVVIDGEKYVVGILETVDFALAVYRKCNKYGERNDKE